MEKRRRPAHHQAQTERALMEAENLYERRIEAYTQARTEEERGDILEAMEEEDFLL